MTDLIDRQAAIESCMNHYEVGNKEQNSVMAWCVDMLHDMPSAQPDVPDTNVGDMISRQAAIDEAYAVIVDDAVYDVVQVETLEALPSTERHGKWLEHKDYPGLAYLCSKCNWFTTDRSFYCPHCGARMDGE